MSDSSNDRFSWRTLATAVGMAIALSAIVQFFVRDLDPEIAEYRGIAAERAVTRYSGYADYEGAYPSQGEDGVAYAEELRDPRSSDEGVRGLIGSAEDLIVHPEEAFRKNVAFYFSSLQSSEVRFNRLKSVPFGEPETITVAITPPGVDANPTIFLGRNGVIEKHAVPLATQVEAELISLDQDVEILPNGPVPILLRPEQEVQTSWRVTARRTRPFTLQLVLTNRVTIEGREVIDRQPFTRRFEVKVNGWRRALIWIDGLDPIWKLLGAIASLAALVAAAIQGFRFFYRTGSLSDDPPPSI